MAVTLNLVIVEIARFLLYNIYTRYFIQIFKKRRQIVDNNLILKRFFSKSMLHDLLSGKSNDVFECVVKRYIADSEGKSYGQLVSEIYAFLGKHYRTEYFYKNTMLNKLLIKRHDYKNTIVLSELPVGNSKADFIMINGKGVVYEIKTELDNLERLDSQIKDYYKAFSEVVIVTYDENIDKVTKVIPDTVGVMLLTKRKALKMIREPLQDLTNLDYDTIFKILRKYEFEKIIQNKGYSLPRVNQFQYYKECYKILSQIDIEELQNAMLGELKQRMKIDIVEFTMSMPEELRFLSYSDDNVLKYEEIAQHELSRSYGG